MWGGLLCQTLIQRGVLDIERGDLGFFFSTDGVKLFNRGHFSVWPLLLVNLNLPPSVRFKEEKLILVGVIPGPRQPKDMNSFFRPLIDEFKILGSGSGVKVWN